MLYLVQNQISSVPVEGSIMFENFQRLMENVNILKLLNMVWDKRALDMAYAWFTDAYNSSFREEYALEYQSSVISKGIKELFTNKAKLKEFPSLVKKARFQGQYLYWTSDDGKLQGRVLM